MARLALASGPATRRRRRRSSASDGLRTSSGYALCLLVAASALVLARWDPPTAEAGPAPAPSAAAHVRVVDGDTLDLAGERVRLLNIDAPEMPPRSKCASEAQGALAATARLNTLVRSGSVTLEREGEDRYGRTLARVYVDGADAGQTLIAAGLVRPWEGRRRSWCV